MRRVLSPASARPALLAAAALLSLLLPGAAAAVKVKVNCNIGQTINDALATPGDPQLVIVVKGTCTENVVVTKDDVTLKTNGIATASIVAADNTRSAVFLNGARRAVIDGVIADGISVSGGTFGIAATRGTTLDVRNCAVSGAGTGIISSYNGILSVDACSVTGNGNGITAANSSTVAVTNSTVSSNTGTGISAVRSSVLRVGQDQSGTATVKPVTVNGNGSSGISITESSSGNVVGGTVSGNTATQVFIGRGSSGQVGLGSGGLPGGVAITNGSSNGISVEGANATIVLSTITGNALRGIVVNNGASARIGITNSNGVFGANTISGNLTDGIGVFHSSAAYIGGNTIDANAVFGINVGQASADLVGGNSITNNGQTGVFVRAGQALIGDVGFGPPTTVNTISGNGGLGPTTGGIFAFEGGNVLVVDATISNNVGAALQAFEAGVFEVRGATAVTVPAGGTTSGAVIQFGSTLRVRETASIVSATKHGIEASNNSSVNVRDGNAVQGNGAGAFGVLCFKSDVNGAPMAESAATLTGNLTGASGTAGATGGCNLFP